MPTRLPLRSPSSGKKTIKNTWYFPATPKKSAKSNPTKIVAHDFPVFLGFTVYIFKRTVIYRWIQVVVQPCSPHINPPAIIQPPCSPDRGRARKASFALHAAMDSNGKSQAERLPNDAPWVPTRFLMNLTWCSMNLPRFSMGFPPISLGFCQLHSGRPTENPPNICRSSESGGLTSSSKAFARGTTPQSLLMCETDPFI